MTIDDMPTGWAEEPKGDGSAASSRCAALTRLRRDARAREVSSRFTRKASLLEQFTFNGGISTFDSVEAASAVVARFKAPAFKRCFAREVEANSAKDDSVEISNVAIGGLAVGAVGEDRSGSRITLHVQSGVFEVDSAADVAVVQRGRAVLFYATSASMGEPSPVLGKRAARRFDRAFATP